MLEVTAEGCVGVPEGALEGVVSEERRVLQENMGDMSFPWSRPEILAMGLGRGNLKKKNQPKVGENKFHQSQIQLFRVHFESHYRSVLSDIK